jgi:oligopeptide transport system substrate-binding protein
VDLARPASWFPALVSNPATAPVPEAWITRPGATEGGAYISSGPFVLTEWVHDQRRTLEPNTMWWGEPSSLARIEMRTFASDGEALDAYRRGELDILYLAEGIGQAPDLESQAHPLPGGQLWYVAFDRVKAGSPTVANAELRRALSLAVDREALSAVLQPDGPVAGSLIPPGMPGHDPSLISVFDPEAAGRSLARALDELGLSSADEIHISMVVADYTETWPASAAYLAEQWRDLLGIEVEVVTLELEAWFELIGQHTHDLEWNAWIPDYPHPQNYLEPTFGCPGGNLNLYGYCNPAYEDLLDRAARAEDTEQQLALYEEAQRLIVEDPVGIFIAWPGGQALVAPWVEGLVLTPMDEADFPGVLFLHLVTVAPHN